MADEFVVKAPTIEQPITLKVEGIKEFSNTLSRIAKGNALQNYWKSQRDLIADVDRAYRNYARQLERGGNTEKAAAELVKLTNALRATAGTDLSQVFKNFDQMSDVIRQAEKEASSINSIFSVENFREAFNTFEALRANGVEVTTVFSKLSAESDVDVLRTQVEQLNEALEREAEKLQRARIEAAQLRDEMERTESGERAAELEGKVYFLEGRLEGIRREFIEEFKSFLSVNNISEYQSEFAQFFDNISNGSMTAKDAIMSFKEQYGYLLEESRGTPGGLLDESQLSALTAKFEELLTRFEQLVTEMKSGGGLPQDSLRGVAEQLSRNTELTDEQREAMARLSSQQDGLLSVTRLLAELVANGRSAQESVSGVGSSLNELLGSLERITSGSQGSLEAVASMFRSLNTIGKVRISQQTLQSIGDLAHSLDDIKNVGSISVIAGMDFSTWKDLKVNQSALENLAKYLKKLEKVDADKLNQVAHVDFSGLRQSISKEFKNPLKVRVVPDTGPGQLRSWGKMIKDALKTVSTNNELTIKISKIDPTSQALSSLQKKISKAISDAFTSAPIGGGSGGSGDSGGGSGSGGGPGGGNGRGIYNQYQSLITQIQEELRKTGSTMSDTSSFAALVQVLETLREQLELCGNDAEHFDVALQTAGINGKQSLEMAKTTLGEYKLALSDTKTATQEAAQAAQAEAQAERETAKAAKDAEKERNKEAAQLRATLTDRTQANNLYHQTANLIDRVSKAQKDWTAAGRGSAEREYKGLQGYIDRLRTLQNELSTGKITTAQARLELSKINAEFNNTSIAIKSAGENVKSFGGRLGDIAGKFGSLFSASRIVMATVRTLRQMINTAIELDSSLTQMQIVTKSTKYEMEDFAVSAVAASRKIGASTKDFIDSATTYARLGYSTDESSMLAQFTTMLQNVGNIDVGTAQSAITAIVKAFDVKVNEIESVMDKMVEVGNNFPISTSEIAEGMNNVASAMAAAGNSYEQTVAILTAANTTVNMCRAA